MDIAKARHLGQTIKGAGRIRKIVGVFASHGFNNIAERTNLGRFIPKRFTRPLTEKYTVAERLRMSFEQLGPTFVKLGQLLATRPDLIPKDMAEEFKKLHDDAKPFPFEQVKEVLNRQYSNLDDVFEFVDEKPLASASIAQVHKARLIDGTQVVLKVRRPGILEIIEEDLAALYTIANLLETYISEAAVYNPEAIVDEFFRTLQLETNFSVEANNIQRFHENFQDDPTIKIPKVYEELSGSDVLVLEALDGIPLSKFKAKEFTEVDPEKIVKKGLTAFFKMVFEDRYFHGDLHSGNLFILPGNRIGLIDFGVVGRLSTRVRDSIANMFVALAQEDYESFAYEFIDLAPYNEATDADLFAKDLRAIIAPYFGLTFKNVNTGQLLMESTSLAAKHGVRVPPELMLFFKAIVTVEGMGRLLVEDFDLLAYSMEFVKVIVKTKYDPEKIIKDLSFVAKESTSLLYSLPRQFKQILRRFNSPDHRWKMDVRGIDNLRRSIEQSSNLLFLGLVIGSLIFSASITAKMETGTYVMGVPIISFFEFLLAGILGLISFYKYIKK